MVLNRGLPYLGFHQKGIKQRQLNKSSGFNRIFAPFYLRHLFSSVPCNGLKHLTIGAYSPLTPACQWTGGHAVKKVVKLALSQVNNRSDILPGYKLQMVLNDTKVCAHYQ